MDAQSLITTVLQDFDRTQTNITAKRRQVLGNLQTIVGLVDNDRDWVFRRKSTQQGRSANVDIANCPTNWLAWGRSGGVFIIPASGPYIPLTWMPPHKWVRANAYDQGGTPTHYAEAGISSAGVQQFGLFPTPTSALQLWIVYKRTTPTITDANPGGLDQIPAQWHQLVILPGVVMLQMKDAGNIQSMTEQKAIYEAGLKSMRINERVGQEAVHRLVPFNPYSQGR